MPGSTYIGIDLGGTNIRAGILHKNKLHHTISRRINAAGSSEEVLQELFDITGTLINESVAAIGIGVPGLVDAEAAMVYDVVNIPVWKKIPLKHWMEDRFKVPVLIENDANCFALGEFYLGKGIGCNSMVGLTIGTGLGAGLILNKKLYSGRNGGAGEFGMISYLDRYFEYYASGQFFKNIYNIAGEKVYANAQHGDESALKMYEEFGTHLGNAIKTVLFSLDIELIVIGGSVRHAYPFFRERLWRQLETFPYQQALQHLKIETAALKNSGVIGAASLYNNFNS